MVTVLGSTSCGTSEPPLNSSEQALFSGFTLANPHRNYPNFFVGSVHNHTIKADCRWYENCTYKSEVIAEFYRRGYEFQAITDHDKSNSDNWGMNNCPAGMICLWGTEASQGQHHLFFGWSQASIDEILDNNQSYRSLPDPWFQHDRYNIGHNISVICHPDQNDLISAPRVFESLYPMPDIGPTLYFDGIEINDDNKFDYWGWALRTRASREQGRASESSFRGFASDDYHPGTSVASISQMDPKGWLLVNSNMPLSWDSIYNNIKSGNFFAVRRLQNTQGLKYLQKPQISVTTTSTNEITVATEALSLIRFYDVEGRIRQETWNTTGATYPVNGDELFVRVVAEQWVEGSLLRIFSQPIAIQYLTPTPTPIPTPTPAPTPIPQGCNSGYRCCEKDGDGNCTLCVRQSQECP